MPKIPREQLDALSAAIHSHECLRNVRAEIAQFERVVFHDLERADWSQAERVAEQILIAEIVLRHRGHPEGLYYNLRAMENGGKLWAGALRDLASYIHSYFTTPLGIIMRYDLFGEDAVFLSPEAIEWVKGRSSQSQTVGTTGL